MPAVPELPRADTSANPYAMCSQRGDGVLHAAYVTVAEAVAGLAANNPALQRRLPQSPIGSICNLSASPQIVACSHYHMAKTASLWASRLSIHFVMKEQLPSS